MKRVFFLGSHPALSAAEIAAYAERAGVRVSWDVSRLPVALVGSGHFPSSQGVQSVLGGTTMIGTLRVTLDRWPTPADLTRHVPEILQPRQGKRLLALSALATDNVRPRTQNSELTQRVRRLAMELKRTIGRKGTRVVFPPARRSDLSTAQLLHNRLPRDGTAVFFLLSGQGSPPTSEERTAPFGSRQRVDLVMIDSIQDIEAYARRDRGRPHADPGTGMMPPKLAQMLVNLSLVPPGGTLYDPFCGVGTVPMEALLMGLTVITSDVSQKQVERTRGNLSWLESQYLQQHEGQAQAAESRGSAIMNDSPSAVRISAGNRAPRVSPAEVFVHNVARGKIPLPEGSVDAIATEGWLGPPRATPPLPHDVENVFARTRFLLENLLRYIVIILKPGARAVMTVPAFRVKKRVIHFPLATLRATGFTPDPLIPQAWDHPLFREAARGTLLYGRPDAIVLREIVRFRRRAGQDVRPR